MSQATLVDRHESLNEIDHVRHACRGSLGGEAVISQVFSAACTLYRDPALI
jgi:hypothetical protein